MAKTSSDTTFGTHAAAYAGTTFFVAHDRLHSCYVTRYDENAAHIWYEVVYYESKHDEQPVTVSFDSEAALVAFLDNPDGDENPDDDILAW